MLAVIERQVGPLHDFSDSNKIGEKYGFNPNEMPEFKRERIESWIEEVARGSSKGQNLLLSGVGRGHGSDFRWLIDLSSDLTAVSIAGMSHPAAAAESLTLLEEAVESHTTAMRRSRRVVIEPVRAAGAAQRKHDEDLAARINRAGMLWGGLAGVLGGGAIQAAFNLLGW
ncbi:hypothetical protein [Promicromonospora sp. NFX87]|uniref:hypothetical protein n=1 Tax=Promicromonospora sp. NFX87 TaxID=3402691 RepID=UPI003AFA0D7B